MVEPSVLQGLGLDPLTQLLLASAIVAVVAVATAALLKSRTPRIQGSGFVSEKLDTPLSKGVLAIEREIIGYALTRIYDAKARGEIGESDFHALLRRYRSELERIERLEEAPMPKPETVARLPLPQRTQAAKPKPSPKPAEQRGEIEALREEIARALKKLEELDKLVEVGGDELEGEREESGSD